MKIINLKYMFANRNSCKALCGSIKNEQELFNFLNQIIMITLEKLAEELNINNIDEVIAGTPRGLQYVQTWYDFWTTFGGTSGIGGVTNTTYPGKGND